jgi:FkbM family methyltransferase
VITLTRGYERISRRPRLRAEQWQRLAEDKAFPIDSAARDLDYAPRPFAEGIRAEAAALGLTPSSPPLPPNSPPLPPACSPPAPPSSASPVPPSRPSRGAVMLSIAKSPLAPVLGQRVPLRGPARLLFSSYAKTRYQPQKSVARVTTVAGDIFDADLSSALEWQLWAFGSYEKHLAELFGYLVRPGDRCVDVGANVGVHTIRLARLVGTGGEVIAIEPDQGMVQRTNRNIALNGLANVRVISAAASERAGEMRLYRPNPWDTNRARASLIHHPYLTGVKTMVPVVTVDNVCAGQPVALIKIDVGGHEAAVIRGAASTITTNAPSVVFEYAMMPRDDAALSPFGWLAEHGYVLFRIRAARHAITDRVRLALDRVQERSPEGGNLLAVFGTTAVSISSLAR